MVDLLKIMRNISLVSLVLIGLIIIFFYVPIEQTPPGNTRIILDHASRTYIAPPCFEQSNPTNFLEETTLKKAMKTEYKASTSCTIESLSSKKLTLFEGLLKKWSW
ncbi:hypothetical protein J6TS2_24020 [Heyndrickxia sporothermodurans]|nr:hypothetical protein J6TS2_24020 [Heyndrickxia sporothermodurans]